MISQKKAFSLFELLITMSILVIIIGLSIPQLLTSHDQVITQEINKIVMIFSYLQQKALASNKTYKLFFDTQTNSYFYHTSDNKRIQHKLDSTVVFGFLPGAKGPPSKPLTHIKQPMSFPYNKKTNLYKAVFSSNGNTTSGTLYLINNHNHMYAFTSSPSTASNLRKYFYDKNRWLIQE